jgi:small subunit ribosomal protein S7
MSPTLSDSACQNMSIILDVLRTAPTPSSQSNVAGRALLSDHQIDTEKSKAPWIPRSNLPLSPIQYLTSAIDSVAPLVKIRQQKGLAGGGASTPIPIPLKVKQRRRTAIKWILASAEGRKETSLAERLAKEIIKVADGSSSAWDKRQLVHRMAVSARSNVRSSLQRRRKRI